MFNRYSKPIINLSRAIARSSTLLTPKTAIRSAIIKGAPPVSCEDIMELPYSVWPRITVEERTPAEQFEIDTKLNEMFCYINGGYGAPRDDRTRDALWDMIDIKCIIAYRDAGLDTELLKVLKKQSGTDELPQLYYRGKCVAKGADFEDAEKIKQACSVAIRPWPRNGPYQDGFDGYWGITESTKLHCGNWKPKVTGAGKPSDREAPRPGQRTEQYDQKIANKQTPQ